MGRDAPNGGSGWPSGAAAAGDQALREEQARRYGEWRSLLGSLLRAVQPERTRAELAIEVDLLAAAIDGLGIQAVLEPKRFTASRLEAAVDELVASAVRSR